ncbi:MAG: hypothetical protein AAGA23_12790 [Pseudomonadota bacterium]
MTWHRTSPGWWLLGASLLLGAGPAPGASYVLTIQGLAGNDAYGQRFTREAQKAHQALSAGAEASLLAGDGATRDNILGELEQWAGQVREDDQVTVLMIGHGAYRNGEYRFAIPGPDLTGADIGSALDQLSARRQVLINTSSASGVLHDQLSARDGRIVVTATRSAREIQAPRFSAHFVAALDLRTADLDKDRRISLGEAFGFAQRAVADDFESEDLLATEHPRLEGDGPERITLTRLGGAEPDADAALLARRQALNDEIDALRARRGDMLETDYLETLQGLLVQLALVESRIEESGDGEP